jgi:hypothetical protein
MVQNRGNVTVTNGPENSRQSPSITVNPIVAYIAEKVGVM